MQANSLRHNYYGFIWPFYSWNCEKKKKKLQKIEYLENDESFLDKIKYIFYDFWKSFLLAKYKKNRGHKLSNQNYTNWCLRSTINTQIRNVYWKLLFRECKGITSPLFRRFVIRFFLFGGVTVTNSTLFLQNNLILCIFIAK